MDVRLRVELDDGVPVVVKSGTGPAAARLRLERERLGRAVHPGVVALADSATDEPDDNHRDEPGAPDVHELRTCYAGEPVSRWAGTVAGIAGLGAAVAATLDDLHALGIVHGRIDGSHILIGDDGRPRLCGLSHPGGAAPADDVAALGEVLRDLLARARPDGRGRRRSSRAARSGRRALHAVVERATDTVATRRPSARILADAIIAAVPGAALPSPTDDVGPAGHDTLDRIWSHAGHESEDERWRQAFGSGPLDLPESPIDGDDRDGPPETWFDSGTPTGDGPRRRAEHEHVRHPVLPPARVDTPDWSATPPNDRPGGDPMFDPDDAPPFRWGDDPAGWDTPDGDLGAAPWSPDRHTAARADRRHPAGADADDPRVAGGAGFDRGTGLDPGTGCDRGIAADDSGGSDDSAGFGDGAGFERGGGFDDVAGIAGRAVPDDDLTRDHRVPVPARSPHPTPADRRAAAGPRRRRLVIAAAAVLVAGVAAAGAATLWPGSGTDGSDPGRPDMAAPAGDCPSVTPPVADVDGDGCPEALVVDGTTVDAGVARWSLGQPGDIVTVGDWDCDGAASAALLRPSTGDVFVFAAWAPTDEPVTVRSTRRVTGGVGIRAEAGESGCDRLQVELASGATTTVAVAG